VKITAIECFALLAPDHRADACSSAQDNLVVKIHTDSGHFGAGETDTNPRVAKAMIEAPGTRIMGLGLKETLIGKDPRDIEGLWEKMYKGSAMTGRRGLGVCAMGALDMALWDLVGKIEGKPCWQLMGGATNQTITPYASLLPDGDDLETYGAECLLRGSYKPSVSVTARRCSRSASKAPIPTTRCKSRMIEPARTWCAPHAKR
jgi:L-rhamnonate dehydratase